MYQIQLLYVNIVSFLATEILLHHRVMYFRDSTHVIPQAQGWAAGTGISNATRKCTIQ